MIKVELCVQEKGGDGRYRWYTTTGYINSQEVESAQVTYAMVEIPYQPVTKLKMKTGDCLYVRGHLHLDEVGNV